MSSTALVFPGQGSQKPGMGKALSENFAVARDVFHEIDEALSQHLTRLMFDGSESDLTLTENAQPAIMAVSLAAFRVMEKEAGFELKKQAAFVAGHSLGEYSALAAAGTFSLADTARLLKLRGRSMQKAVPQGEGTMAAILGLEMDAVEAIAREASAGGEVCDVANDNSPGQIVISGSRAGVEKAIALATERGAKRALELNVSAPFHCSLMQPAAVAMREALATTGMHAPLVPLVANVTASATCDVESIRAQLVEQVTGRVRWRESVSSMKAQGVGRMIEIGEGKVLSGLIKRIEKEIETLAVGAPEDIETLVKAA